MGLYNYYFTQLVNKGSYTAESGKVYSALDFIEIAKGNIQYALVLRDRMDWQHVESVVEEDLSEGEILEIEDQYVMTNGEEIEVHYTTEFTC